jgi:hypothetical protein
MFQKVLAGIGLAICLALLLGMALGATRRQGLRALLERALNWRQHRVQARREAASAIERARRAVERDGNVYRPGAFGKRPPDDKLH